MLNEEDQYTGTELALCDVNNVQYAIVASQQSPPNNKPKPNDNERIFQPVSF